MIIEGAIAVKAAMDSKYRKVETIYIDKDKHTSDVAFIVHEAYKCRVNVERVPREFIEQNALGRTHGGIIREVQQRRFQSVTSQLVKE